MRTGTHREHAGGIALGDTPTSSPPSAEAASTPSPACVNINVDANNMVFIQISAGIELINLITASFIGDIVPASICLINGIFSHMIDIPFLEYKGTHLLSHLVELSRRTARCTG